MNLVHLRFVDVLALWCYIKKYWNVIAIVVLVGSF